MDNADGPLKIKVESDVKAEIKTEVKSESKPDVKHVAVESNGVTRKVLFIGYLLTYQVIYSLVLFFNLRL